MEKNRNKYAYTRSLCMMLYCAVRKRVPGKILRIEHSISHGLYCRILNQDESVSEVNHELVGMLRRDMKSLVDRDIPFERHTCARDEALEIFRREGLMQKVALFETLPDMEEVAYYTLDGVSDSYVGSLMERTSMVSVFDLRPYKEGMLLMGPDPKNPSVAALPIKQNKMYNAFRKSLEFNKVIKVDCVGRLNEAVRLNETSMLIDVAEAMHAKALSRISDDIMWRHRKGGASVVMIAGPSSSGKTTTCKRLAVQLMTNMITPRMISLDDYFVDRDRTPLDEYGDYDFESLYALDLKRFNDDLNALLSGKEINLPTYSFELGRRVEKPRPLKLESSDVLIIEGIHGLNPELVSDIAPDNIYKLYVSALTSMRLDNHNWISTSDNRLLRRMVRDSKYRGISPEQTLGRWPSVRRGEEKWIFPFQENADAVFNSSLIFELGVMKEYLEPLLLGVPEDSPCYDEARWLADFLGYFLSIPDTQVPFNSLLREFLGGSAFHY